MDLGKQIEQEIARRVDAAIVKKIETAVKYEILKALKKYGVAGRVSGRENGNINVVLVDVRDPRVRIGTLSVDCTKKDCVRFRLGGLIARSRQDQIDFDQLFDVVRKSVNKNLRWRIK